MAQKQYFSVCPKEMAMHLKEEKPKTILELGDKAENYGNDPKPSNIRSLKPETR